MLNLAVSEITDGRDGRLQPAVSGTPHTIGSGFTASHFSEEMFGGRMDPLLMVDHFVMTEPTFAPHLHAGISAVTLIFEDATGDFLNRDTLGVNLALKPGDLYWLAAAGGAAHEEKPDAGARTHALQIFVNLPARMKHQPARALLVRAGDVPVLKGQKHRVRVLLGRSGDTVGAEGTPEEMTVLDGFVERDGRFFHRLPADRQAWIYAVDGNVTVRCEGRTLALAPGAATTVVAGADAEIALEANEPAHFVLMAGRPIRETFVKQGPLVMSSADEVRRTLDDYAGGKFGRIPA